MFDGLPEKGYICIKTKMCIRDRIKPGVTTKELDKVAEEFIRDNGAVPTFKRCV